MNIMYLIAAIIVMALLECVVEPLAMPMQRVAIVTGASRGIGKGIALELGQAGYAVHCLGRSTRNANAERDIAAEMGPYRRLPENEELTVERTAEQGKNAARSETCKTILIRLTSLAAVSSLGGRGVAHVCDCSVDGEVAFTIRSITESEGGRLDCLVCSAYSVPAQKLRDDFWKQGMEMWDAVNGVGLRSVYATCLAAAPSMIETAKVREYYVSDELVAPSHKRYTRSLRSLAKIPNSPPPLMCLVSSFGGKSYTFNVAYGVGKAAVDRLANDMALQLRSHDVATVSLYPGLVRTEANLEMEKVRSSSKRSDELRMIY
ncbi:hypothetical protein TL16_g12120 [Triparma laevis f. inornata]|uniref:Uncharacterized protein n=1 Tax=Triparma laevis f. inornata TaxID=1714386 RepID=A0A9W7BJQ9_9STRA|nr:hypothetical protein TL16_g12120 [Triparma laevis f. inornata]